MKIGIVTQSYKYDSGVSENAVHSGLEMQRLGHDVTVITANFPGENIDRGLKVIRVGQNINIPMNGTFVNLTVGYKLSDKLKKIFAKEKFDITHIHCPLDPILPLTALKAAKSPVVGTFHTYAKNNPAYALFAERFNKYFKMLSGRIVVSEASKRFISRYFDGDYRMIPNGVDIKRFNPKVAPVKKFNDGKFNIVFVGRLDPRKGLRFLLQAFPIVYGHKPNARLIVVGRGLLGEYYKRFLLKELAGKVFFEGYVSGKYLPGYYSAADIFCAPATHGECFGLVLLEAMAAGKPVVASDNEGYRTVLSAKEGVLVEPKNPVRLAKAIIGLMDDKEKRMKLGKAGLQKAKEYSWETITKRILEYYDEILKNPK